jgi:hypothetical protein
MSLQEALRGTSHYGRRADKNSSNLIGEEQKFVCLAFTLKANNQGTKASKMPIWYTSRIPA